MCAGCALRQALLDPQLHDSAFLVRFKRCRMIRCRLGTDACALHTYCKHGSKTALQTKLPRSTHPSLLRCARTVLTKPGAACTTRTLNGASSRL